MRDLSMHGSLEHMERLMNASRSRNQPIDVNSYDADSGRTALHKAAAQRHEATLALLLQACPAAGELADRHGKRASERLKDAGGNG